MRSGSTTTPSGRTTRSAWRPSFRSFPERLPEIASSADHIVHIVKDKGGIRVGGLSGFISEALCGLSIGGRSTSIDGVFVVRSYNQVIKRLDLRSGS